jgi:hypothetical protein
LISSRDVRVRSRHALYFAGDHRAGDLTGEGLNQFGGGWDVVSPAGDKIEGGG